MRRILLLAATVIMIGACAASEHSSQTASQGTVARSGSQAPNAPVSASPSQSAQTSVHSYNTGAIHALTAPSECPSTSASCIDDAFGYGGLGQVGTGASAGGWGDGLGLGSVGGFGHGSGTGTGRNNNKPKPTLHDLPIQATGGDLPPEVIRRIVRANFPRFRQCYEIGLQKNGKLAGKIEVLFVIANDGAVDGADVADATLDDLQVQSCVVGVYKTLSFPPPENGAIQVRFPIEFLPPPP